MQASVSKSVPYPHETISRFFSGIATISTSTCAPIPAGTLDEVDEILNLFVKLQGDAVTTEKVPEAVLLTAHEGHGLFFVGRDRTVGCYNMNMECLGKFITSRHVAQAEACSESLVTIDETGCVSLITIKNQNEYFKNAIPAS